jgi:hypothetical protein
VNSLITNELNYDLNAKQRIRDQQYVRLNANQLHYFDMIVTIIDRDSQIAHFFVQELASTSKIFLYQILCYHFRARDEIVICVASSSITTLLLLDDQTSYFRFKISLQITKNTTCNIIRDMHLYELL